MNCFQKCENSSLFKGRKKAIQHALENCPNMILVCGLCKKRLRRKSIDAHYCFPEIALQETSSSIDSTALHRHAIFQLDKEKRRHAEEKKNLVE